VNTGCIPVKKMQKQANGATWVLFLRWPPQKSTKQKFSILRDINRCQGAPVKIIHSLKYISWQTQK
jgi:hypothetical protein